LFRFFGAKWFFDIFNNNVLVYVILSFSYRITFKLLERGFIEAFVSDGVSRKLKIASRNYSNMQSGFLYHYILYIITGIIMMIFFIYDIFGDMYIFPFLILFLETLDDAHI